MNIILLGPPGSGKGTQAEFLKHQYGLIHLSTGERLRQEIKDDTELGRKAKDLIDQGKYVPDDMIVDLVSATLDLPEYRVGVIFDGYPRTVTQAIQLDKMLEAKKKTLAHVIELVTVDEALINLISGRFHCTACCASYNEYYKPPVEAGSCDVCGGHSFAKRPDDAKETVKERLRIYKDQTEPLLSYYAGKGILRQVDGLKEMHLVSEDIRKIIELSLIHI